MQWLWSFSVTSITPPSNQTLLRAEFGRGPPTFPQHFLNPRYPHRVLESQVLYHLSCSELRVPPPYCAYPDSCSSEAVKLPPHLLLHRAKPGSGQPTRPQ